MQADARHEAYLCDDAEIVLVAYGICSRIARTAAEALRAEGVKAGVFRPLTLSPFPDEALSTTLLGRRAMVVELSAGQFYNDVILALATVGGRHQEVGLCNRMGGMVMTVADVVSARAAMKKQVISEREENRGHVRGLLP